MFVHVSVTVDGEGQLGAQRSGISASPKDPHIFIHVTACGNIPDPDVIREIQGGRGEGDAAEGRRGGGGLV